MGGRGIAFTLYLVPSKCNSNRTYFVPEKYVCCAKQKTKNQRFIGKSAGRTINLFSEVASRISQACSRVSASTLNGADVRFDNKKTYKLNAKFDRVKSWIPPKSRSISHVGHSTSSTSCCCVKSVKIVARSTGLILRMACPTTCCSRTKSGLRSRKAFHALSQKQRV